MLVQLRAYAADVRRTRAGPQRELAITVLLAAAAKLRLDGVTWSELATGFGVSVATLRRWHRQYAPDRKQWPPSANPIRVDRLPSRTPVASPSKPCVLFVAGHPGSGGNDFAREAATIRGYLMSAGIDVPEHSYVELAEIPVLLDRWQPAVLHVSAHASFLGVALCLDGQECYVDPVLLVEAIVVAEHRPAAVVLSFCDSAWTAARLAYSIASVVSWQGMMTDEQSRTFAGHLYRALARGRPVGSSFEAAQLTVSAKWGPDLRPSLYGSSAQHPFQ